MLKTLLELSESNLIYFFKDIGEPFFDDWICKVCWKWERLELREPMKKIRKYEARKSNMSAGMEMRKINSRGISRTERTKVND